ncbi:MAG TPA: dynamin family protein [Candidatus Methylomirabilis sp.]|nr:dynamin family protein [Candidatus Methylomirabilis sp.]
MRSTRDQNMTCATSLQDRLGQARDDLLDILTAIAQMLDGVGLPSQPAAVAEDRLRHNRFDIVVLGQYKRGKTTFINALIGEPLLPTAIVPLTNIATRVRHALHPSARVTFLDGRFQEISLQELELYTTEKGNPGNAKAVLLVEVEFPAAALRDGTMITDTPGIASTFEQNTRAAMEYVPQADAAIFLVNADPPISEAERTFLKEVRPYLAKLFFVQNKIDQVSPEDQEESLAFTRGVVEETMGEFGIVIYPVSARLALEAKLAGDTAKLRLSRFDQFEQGLHGFLQRAKGRALLASAAGKATRLLASLKSRAELERHALEMDLADLIAKAESFDRHLDDVERARFDDKAVLRAQIGRLVAEHIDARLEAFQAENLPRLRQALTAYATRPHRLTPLKFKEGLRSHAMGLIKGALQAWEETEEEALAQGLKGLLRRFTDQTNALLGRVAADCEALFGVKFDLFVPEEELPADTRFYHGDWFVADGIDLAIGVAAAFLPISLVRRRILAETSRGMAEKLNMECGRLRYDFVRRIEARVHEFTAGMDEHLARAISGIREVVGRTLSLRQEREEEAAMARARVEDQLARYSILEGRLHTISEQVLA